MSIKHTFMKFKILVVLILLNNFHIMEKVD